MSIIRDFAIFIDLDGTLADNNGGLTKIGFQVDPALNIPSSQLPFSGLEIKRKMYATVKGTDFYANLPLLPDAVKLYNFCYDAHPIILTAAPKFDASEEDYYINPHWLGASFHKRNWVERVLLPAVEKDRLKWHQKLNTVKSRYHIPDERFVCTTGSRKHLFMHRKHSDHQILIDDRRDNIEAWESAGGIGVLHTSGQDSIAQLKDILSKIK